MTLTLATDSLQALFEACCNLTKFKCVTPNHHTSPQNTLPLITVMEKQVLSKRELPFRTHTLVGLAGWSDSCSAAAAG